VIKSIGYFLLGREYFDIGWAGDKAIPEACDPLLSSSNKSIHLFPSFTSV
jgi:hypothetical protein